MGVDLIMVNGEQIAEIYTDYKQSLLEVNRTYQRKLVWTLEEKQKLIDTILKGYPVPLFLFASHKAISEEGKTVTKREIIDGLQRLDAIISFMNNDFSVRIDGKEGYFDLSSSSVTIPLMKSKKLIQKKPVLETNLCSEFTYYRLAVTTIEADSVSVEDVFKRINATGRQLSPQELRQAGVVSKFSDMVQILASCLRKDYTEQNIIPLEDMQKYSLSSGELHYGIDIRKVFWTKQGIISYDALRRSKDEEIITHICNCILSDYKAGISKKTLDNLYNDTSLTFKKNEQYLTDEHKTDLINQILEAFEDINKAISCVNQTFKALITHNERGRNMDLVFIIIFLAVFQLKNAGYYCSDYSSFAETLRNIADDELSDLIEMQDVKWDCNIRNRWIERIVNRIKKCMNLNNTDPQADKELRELLRRAVAEEQMYDFKIGVTNLTDGTFNSDLVAKCVKTLIAMSNTNPSSKGYVILGIANDKDAADSFEKHYNQRVLKYGNLFVTGVESEAVKYYQNIDNYLKRIKNKIDKLGNITSTDVIRSILTNMHLMSYGNGVLAVLSLQSDGSPLFYEGKFFVRYQSSNKELKAGTPEFDNALRLIYNSTKN